MTVPRVSIDSFPKRPSSRPVNGRLGVCRSRLDSVGSLKSAAQRAKGRAVPRLLDPVADTRGRFPAFRNRPFVQVCNATRIGCPPMGRSFNREVQPLLEAEPFPTLRTVNEIQSVAMTRAMMIALALGTGATAPAPRPKPAGLLTPVASGQLGGIVAVLQYEVVRPDRREVAFTFLAGSVSGAKLPEEVQVRGRDGGQLHLSAQEGADCTLSAVEIVPAPDGHAAVVSAVRRFSPVLSENDYSAPAPMEVQVYRPVHGKEPGESSIVLRPAGAPVITPALCDAATVRRAMLTAARKIQ